MFKRKADIMEVPLHFDLTHFRGETSTRRKFVYCPVGNICSWNPGDYDHEWCHWCKIFYRLDQVNDMLLKAKKPSNGYREAL